jgi:hypothetical protein
MGLTIEEVIQDGLAMIDLGKRVAAAEAAVPDVLDSAGVKDDVETAGAKALVAAAFIPEAVGLALKIRRDVKS